MFKDLDELQTFKISQLNGKHGTISVSEDMGFVSVVLHCDDGNVYVISAGYKDERRVYGA